MCGIIGIIDTKQIVSADDLRESVIRMRDRMSHRGPDASGLWQDARSGVVLAHRRLSIIDLTEHGSQPMESPSGRYVITFNGEIYNYSELRNKLSFEKWRGHSDTETLLVAFEEWGIEKALSNIRGMFAFGVWDRQERILTLACDRIGEKPLYYGWVNGSFIFASESSAIAAHPDFKKDISTDALATFLRWNYIPAPYSIYKDLQKLRPGHMLSVSLNTPEKPSLKSYWSAELIATKQNQNIYAKDTLHHLLKDAIKEQMVGDVPVGAFLSGGVDSSLVVALMQSQSAHAVQTFTVGFEEQAYNEAPFARAVAKYLDTNHTEVLLTTNEAQQLLQEMPSFTDEPMADATAIPSYFVSKTARKAVTVALSGAGGDELFGGYPRYQNAPHIWNMIQKLPYAVRPALSHILSITSIVLGNKGYKLSKLADAVSAQHIDALHHKMTSFWQNTTHVIQNQSQEIVWPEINVDVKEPQLRMQLLDLLSYLPHDILAMTDRTSMAVSLEVRAPLLHVPLVEYALQSPLEFRDRKRMLKQVLFEYVPQHLVERPKLGFGVPIQHWLRGDLRDWAESLLSEKALSAHGLFHTKPIRKHWHDFQSGKNHLPYHIWSILMFQSWYVANHE